MTPLLKIQLAQSNTRKELSELMTMPEEKRSDTFHDDVTKLTKQLANFETEVSAARLIEDEPEHRTDSSEGRELRGLMQRANVGEIFDAAIGKRIVDGATQEIQKHYGLDSNVVPLALLMRSTPEVLETRAVTPAPSDVGQNQQSIIPYVFPASAATFLGVSMPSVGVGEPIYPVLTSELTVGTPVENAEQDETTGAFSTFILSPSRIQASYFYSREDRARFAGMDAALRENLSMGLSDAFDEQILAGTNGLFTGTNLANHNVSAETTYALYRSQLVYGRIDGRYASVASDVKILMGAATYAHAAGEFRGNNDNMDALTSVMNSSGGVRVSAHVPAAVSSKQNAVIKLGSYTDMVAPVWEGVTLIPDEITLAKKGQLMITAVMLHAVRILRTDGFYKQQTQHA